MKNRGIEIDFVCKKCGKHPPVDKSKSNKNWTVYDTSKPCECGGEFTVKFGGDDA